MSRWGLVLRRQALARLIGGGGPLAGAVLRGVARSRPGRSRGAVFSIGPHSPCSPALFARLRPLLGPGCPFGRFRNGRQCDSSVPGCGVRLVVGFGSVFGPRSRGPRPRPRWGNPSGGAWPRWCWRALSAPPVRRASALSARGGPVARAACPPRLARLAPALCWLRASVRLALGPPCLCGPWPVSAFAPPPKGMAGTGSPPPPPCRRSAPFGGSARPGLRPLAPPLRGGRLWPRTAGPLWSVRRPPRRSCGLWVRSPGVAACGGPVMISAQIGSVKGCASEGSVRRRRPMPSPLTSPVRRSGR